MLLKHRILSLLGKTKFAVPCDYTVPTLPQNNLKEINHLLSQWVTEVKWDHRKICDINTAYLGYYTFPFTSVQEAMPAIKYLAWIFYYDDLWDDICDKNEAEVEQMVADQKHILSFLRCREYFPSASVRSRSPFFDICNDLFSKREAMNISVVGSGFPSETQSDYAIDMLADDIELYFEALATMNELNKSAKLSPVKINIEKYFMIRRNDIGLQMIADLSFFLCDKLLNMKYNKNVEEVMKSDAMFHLKCLCADHVVLINEIGGLQKDINEGFGLNAILMLSADAQTDSQSKAAKNSFFLDEKYWDVVFLLNSKVDEFVKVRDNDILKLNDPMERAAIDSYINTLQNWLVNGVQWYFERETIRYRYGLDVHLPDSI